MSYPTSPAVRDALDWLYRYRWWINAVLVTVMALVGTDKPSTWIIFGPFVLAVTALVWVPIAWRSTAEFKTGLRGE